MDKAEKHAKDNHLWFLKFKIDGKYRREKAGSIQFSGSVPKKVERRLWNTINALIVASGEDQP
jgi:hypothetical protein